MSGAPTLRLGAGDTDLACAAALLVAGEVVGLPTETVYGLAARADDADAIARLYVAKGRPSDNPLIVHVASMAALTQVTRHVTPLAARLIEHFAPGPLTVVLDAHPDLPRAVTAGLDTVAVRIPDHPVILDVLRRCGLPLAAPSANRSGRPSPTCAAHVLDDLDGRIAAVVDGGPTRLGLESTVVDARGTVPTVLRDGAVSLEELRQACGDLIHPRDAEPHTGGQGAGSPPRSPGIRHRHYAPDLPVHLAEPGAGLASALAIAASLRASGSADVGAPPRVGLVTVGLTASATAAAATQGPEAGTIELLATPADATSLAADLFALLRRAEDRGLAALVVEGVPDVGIGRAVMDRLRRAAAASGGSLR